VFGNQREQMPLIDVWGEFLHQTAYADLPEEVIRCTKLHMLDFLAVAFSGFRKGIHRFFMRFQEGSDQSPLGSVVGEGTRIPWTQAALVNSSMCPADLTDGSRFAGLHPSSIVMPSALAAFEGNPSHAELDGRTFLLAVALGYEIMIRTGRAMNPSAVERGFHLTPTVGPLASAAATGRIMNLDRSRLANALCIAATLGSGLLHAFQAPEPFVQVQIARACEGGMFAALLAREGIRGNPRILEDAYLPAYTDRFNLNLITQGLGKEFMIPQAYMKTHAGCRHIHAPIDAVLLIVQQNRISWKEITGIKVGTYSVARKMEIEHPQTGDHAKFNMAFGIAVALIRGNVLPEQFQDQNLKDAQIQELMKKVALETSPELDRDYPTKRGTVVEIMTHDGKTYTQALDVARGEPEFPLSPEEVEEKFRQSASGLIEPRAQGRAIHFIQTLEDQKGIAELFRCLRVKA
jgi:2-methylcitrate dehydratase PrpD